MSAVQMSLKKVTVESKNRAVMRQFLSLPVILGVLLIITGGTGIYISKWSLVQLIRLDDTAIDPILAFDEIASSLRQVSHDLSKLSELDDRSEAHAKMKKKVRNNLEKIGRRVRQQREVSHGLLYERYLSEWIKEWTNFYTLVEARVGSDANDPGNGLGDWVKEWDHFRISMDPKWAPSKPDHRATALKFEELKFEEMSYDLIDKIRSITTFIQSDVKNTLDVSRQISDNANIALMITLFLGVLIIFSSFVIARSVRSLFEVIAEGKKNIETLLNNLDQGFFVFNQQGIIQEGVSQAAKEFLGLDPTGESFQNVLPENTKGKDGIASWLELVFEGSLRFVDFEPLAPQYFENYGKFVELDFRPIYLDGQSEKLDKIICIASDKTEERKLRQKAEAEAALVKLFMAILTDRPSFVHFVHETRGIIGQMRSELFRPQPRLDVLYRGMHSLKGGSAVFGMKGISDLAHQFENHLSELRSGDKERLEEFLPQLKTGLDRIEQNFEGFLKEHEGILGKINGNRDERTKAIPTSMIYQMCQLMFNQMGGESKVFQDYLRYFVQEDLALAFKRFEPVVQGIAERQMKKVELKIEIGKVRVFLDPYLPLISSLIHVFRNAMDHGIEDEVTRVEKGKSPVGTIQVRFETVQTPAYQKVRIIIEDDGKGIDPELIRKKFLQRGGATVQQIQKMSTFELLQVLFENGFSTRDEVSDLSGRGVGTDIVRVEARKLGGEAWIESTLGVGTRFILEVPLYESPVRKGRTIQVAPRQLAGVKFLKKDEEARS